MARIREIALPWTQQPHDASAGLRSDPYRRALYTPIRNAHPSLVTTGAPTISATPHGLGYRYGSGNYHKFAPGLFRDSGGSGGDPSVAWSIAVSFVVHDDSFAQDAICSVADTETQGNPGIYVYVEYGVVKFYPGFAALGSATIGKLCTVEVVYSDMAPYVCAVGLDGVHQYTTGYNYQFWSQLKIYLGSGYPTQAQGITILQATMRQGAGLAQVVGDARFSRDPWDEVFEPQRILVPVYGAAPSGVPDIAGIVAESILSTSAGYRVTLDYA